MALTCAVTVEKWWCARRQTADLAQIDQFSLLIAEIVGGHIP